MNASEEEPFSPVHLAELVMAPDDIKMSLRVCLKHNSNQLFAASFEIGQHLLSRGVRGSLLKHIIHTYRLLTTLNHTADQMFIKGCHATNVRQDIGSRPFPCFWNRAKGGVRYCGGRSQKLLMRLSQCFNKLFYSATHRLTRQITANASNLLLACLRFFLSHSSSL